MGKLFFFRQFVNKFSALLLCEIYGYDFFNIQKIALLIFHRIVETTVLFEHKNYSTGSDFFFTKVIVK